jgi:membrane-bound metal-dependent hydrolase YbcI (DUF457 family)
MMTLNHGLSGYLVGQVAMPLVRQRSPVPVGALGAAMFLGAMAPDIDVLSRLVGRDVYFSDGWMGHRAASHSIVGTLVLGLVVGWIVRAFLAWRGGAATARHGFAWLAACGWAGGLLHIFGDLFTPGMAMPVFWPLAERHGGWRHIGWFSPFLLWWFVGTIALGTAMRAVASRAAGARGAMEAARWGVYAMGSYGWLHYLVVSRYESGEQWQAYQRTLLPDVLIAPLSAAVSAGWRWISS